MMRLMKLAGFLIFLAVPLLLATMTQAALIAQYFEEGWTVTILYWSRFKKAHLTFTTILKAIIHRPMALHFM